MIELLKRILTGIIFGVTIFSLIIFFPNYVFSIFLVLYLFLILLIEWPNIVLNWKTTLINKILLTFFYPILPFLFIIFLQQTNYKSLNLLLFSLAFAHDVGSYFTGKYFGSLKLCPTISPQKTWEGFIGGIIFTFMVAKTIFFKKNMEFHVLLLFIFIFCIFCTAGDLFESYLKRKSKIKDSSQILPGHGGLLDRFDSIAFAAILILTLKNWLLRKIVIRI